MANLTVNILKCVGSLSKTKLAYYPKFQNSIKTYSSLLKKQEGLSNCEKEAFNLSLKDLKDWGKIFETKKIQQRFWGTETDIAYHGSPFSFDKFDAGKIGSGEGLNKRGKGIYLFRTKRNAPYFANIRSKDAPIHIGSTKKLNNPEPHIYTVSGLNSLNIKKVSSLEAKNIAKNQETFMINNPNINGIELESGEICIFPSAIKNLKIAQKTALEDFVKQNKGYDFREWTNDSQRLKHLESI